MFADFLIKLSSVTLNMGEVKLQTNSQLIVCPEEVKTKDSLMQKYVLNYHNFT